MNFYDRIIFVGIFIILTIFLLVIIQDSKKFHNSLQISSEGKKNSPKSKQNISSKLSSNFDARKDAKPTNGSNMSDETGNSSSSKENLFKELHKFSVLNPDFRHYMNWPPFPYLSPHNPNLATIWNTPITPDMPNWKKFHYQISKHYLYEDSPMIEDLLHDIATKKIIAVVPHPGGTQLKLIIYFEDGGRALFKPMRFPKGTDVFQDNLYLSDFERHHSEIAAFHLDRILEFRRAPPVVGRRVSITKEIIPFFDEDAMIDTVYFSPDGNYCFHGNCSLYCDVFHGFCGDPDMIEGSFAAYLPPAPYEFLTQMILKNPWHRTYIPNLKAIWEVVPDFCYDNVMTVYPFNSTRRIFDIVDCAIFDYLIGNQDRHHFDEFLIFGRDSSSTLIHLDNGRGFGNPDHDEETILYPLLQCCMVRLSTFNKLYSFHLGQSLSDLMRKSLKKDPLTPVLTERHLTALDRRVKKVLTTIRKCININSPSIVFLDDIKF